MRGHFRHGADAEEEWCERRLLARIHRYTIKQLRKQVEPVSPASYMRFLFAWHEMGAERSDGPEAIRRALQKLQGFAAPAGAWEGGLLPPRVDGYFKTYLDQVLTSGACIWLRPVADTPAESKREIPVAADPRTVVQDGQRADGYARNGPVRNTPIMLLDRTELDVWLPLVSRGASAGSALAADAERVRSVLREQGATFFADLVRFTGLLRTQVERALGELVSRGLVTSDSFAGLRALITPASKRASFSRPRRRERGWIGRRECERISGTGH